MEQLETKGKGGTWAHAANEDFFFYWMPDEMSNSDKETLKSAAIDALKQFPAIKKSVVDQTGVQSLDGAYLLSKEEMIKSMNNLDGMSEAVASANNQSGKKIAAEINQEFFEMVLADLKGDVSAMMEYLNKSMSKVQAVVKNNSSSKTFGTVICTIGLLPGLGLPITTFKYVFSNSESNDWFSKILCFTSEVYTYSYESTILDFVYEK